MEKGVGSEMLAEVEGREVRKVTRVWVRVVLTVSWNTD
jgi:hypothetical protein